MAGDQTRVLAGMFAAAVFGALWVAVGFAAGSSSFGNSTPSAERLAYALRYEIFVALTLLVGVGNVARQRFFSAAAIDGSAPARGSAIDIDTRYIQNTTEQCVLAIPGHLALAVSLPAASLHVIPVLVSLFVFARACFWIGYRVHPATRAFGFAATFYPTVGVYLYVLAVVVGGPVG